MSNDRHVGPSGTSNNRQGHRTRSHTVGCPFYGRGIARRRHVGPADKDDTVTTITAPDLQLAPTSAHDVVSLRRTPTDKRCPFSEVREARRQHTLQVAAISTGIVTVTVAASAAVILALSA